MLDGTSFDKALLAILKALGNEVELILWKLVDWMVFPNKNLFMVGPNSPRGLIAKGRSCCFEAKSSRMISSPEMVMPVAWHVRALLIAMPL